MKIVLFGASDFSKTIDYYITTETSCEVVGYTATKHPKGDSFTQFNNKPFIPFDDVCSLYNPEAFQMFVAVGYVSLNTVRKRFIEEAKSKGFSLFSHISPTSIKHSDLFVGENVFVFEGNIIQPNVRLEDGVILGRGNSIGHDSIIHKYSFIANRSVLCGNCHIGAESFIGSNATISDGVTISEKNIIGAASYIRKDTGPSEVYHQQEARNIGKKSGLFFRW